MTFDLTSRERGTERPAGTTPGSLAASSVAAPAGALHEPIAPSPTHDQIANAAFYQWLTHGGAAERNWLECERKLRMPRSTSGGATGVVSGATSGAVAATISGVDRRDSTARPQARQR